MIPDLGKYAATVLGAYGLTFLLMGGLIGLSIWQAARMRRKLAEVERRVRS
ncbi:heme exporter protein CcmD [Falsirhodobacter halotolerans]|uniref:heme exporter protein CcmD n=1 Tax=Falsirhodobacter halotolerans TaxID=1146892 RepID=UPI001FD38E9B|nr:heme exporter protein CcmD [Falsirhodobacter halotolerans]MCJ8139812.1 heme exporter protein CcmD [Falsirhodobacter halotolerans]